MNSAIKSANRGWRTIALVAVMYALCTTKAAQPGALAQEALSIQVTPSGPKAFGGPIGIAWKIVNTTDHLLTGSIVYYVDSNAVSSLDLPNDVNIALRGTFTGTYTFPNPGPGSHLLGVSLLDRTATPPTTSHPPVQVSTIGAKPDSTSEPSTPPKNPGATIVADGTVRIYTSEKIPTLTALSGNQKTQLLQMYAPLLLFSYDHSEDEQYAPIDVVDFIHASDFVSHDNQIPGQTKAQLQQELAILNPVALSTINPSQVPPAPGQSVLPRNVYLSPSSAAEHGSDWGRQCGASPRRAIRTCGPSEPVQRYRQHGHYGSGAQQPSRERARARTGFKVQLSGKTIRPAQRRSSKSNTGSSSATAMISRTRLLPSLTLPGRARPLSSRTFWITAAIGVRFSSMWMQVGRFPINLIKPFLPSTTMRMDSSLDSICHGLQHPSHLPQPFKAIRSRNCMARSMVNRYI